MSNSVKWLVCCILFVILSTELSVSYANAEKTGYNIIPFKPAITLADKNYLALMTELRRYQAAAQKLWIPIAEESKFKPGKHYNSMPLLRDHLQITGDLENDSPIIDDTLYDKSLVKAVKKFQRRHDLQADGIVGSETIAEMNVSPQERIKKLQINITRWMLLSKQLGDRFIIVNIPDYELYLFDHGNQALMMRAIVGKPDWQTPELNSRITRIIYNPYWHVPDKIAAHDLVPKVKSDPYYLEDMHIKVYVKNSGHSERISADEIDWESVKNHDSSPYSFRQEPGDDNALGLVKFEFPNSYDIYLHDTPVKSLFDESERDLSHGCIRLEKPLDLANYLMKENAEWNEARVQDILGTHKTTYVSIPKPISLYITYITVWADENGVVNYRDDIYDRDI